MTEFKREHRYIVFKLKDISKYLSTAEREDIMTMGHAIANGRAEDGKPPFNAAVIEQDWPEFEPVWAMIESRMTGRAIEREVLTSKAAEPQWIVNNLGELGVRVGDRFFFLYKGDNIEYSADDALEEGDQRLYRMVGKREFGETCHPLKWIIQGRSEPRYTDELVYTPGLSFGKPEDGAWKPLPPSPPPATTQHPAPCPAYVSDKVLDTANTVIERLDAKVAELESENKAIRILMDMYNLGGWTDSLGCIKDLTTKVAEIEAENARLTKGYNEWKAYANQRVADVKEAESTIEQQSEALKLAKEALPKLLDKAFLFGENHWREADSESYAANKRSEVTLEKYQAFKAEALAAITEIEGAGK